MRITIILALLIYSTIGISCSCIEPGKITDSEIKSAKAVFIGEILSVSEDKKNFTKTATFKVNSMLLGKKREELTVKTNLDGASCGLNFKKGQKWYVFAYDSDGEMRAGLCGRSVQLSGVSRLEKKHLIGRKNLRMKRKRARQDKGIIRKYLSNHKAANNA